MRITCVGGGPAGLYTAVLAGLLPGDHEISVHDRFPAGETFGWGVVLWDGVLAQLDAHDPVSAGRIRAAGRPWADQLVTLGDRPTVRLPGQGVSIARRTLLGILAERAEELGVQLHHGVDLDGDPPGDPDLVVAADGLGSRLRRRAAGEFGTRVVQGRNKYLWLGTSAVLESFSFPFVRTDAGWVWAHAYAHDASTSTVIVETTPEAWAGLGFDRAGPEETLRRLEQVFAAQLRGAPLMLPPGTGDDVPWGEFPTVSNDRWCAGRVALVGDAAHTTHFSIGSGTTLALQDAMALAEALREQPTVHAALETYDRRRRTELLPIQATAANSARWFENFPRYAGHGTDAFVRLLERRRSSMIHRMPPRAYLALTGAADVLPGLSATARGARGRVRRLRRRPAGLSR